MEGGDAVTETKVLYEVESHEAGQHVEAVCIRRDAWNALHELCDAIEQWRTARAAIVGFLHLAAAADEVEKAYARYKALLQ